jgi:hypothetical protein
MLSLFTVLLFFPLVATFLGLSLYTKYPSGAKIVSHLDLDTFTF